MSHRVLYWQSEVFLTVTSWRHVGCEAIERMPIATIAVWSDPVDARFCSVVVYEDGCELELHAHGRRVLSSTCATVADALRLADDWHPLASDAHPEAA